MQTDQNKNRQRFRDLIAFFRKKQQLAIFVLAALLLADFIFFGCLFLHGQVKHAEQERSAQWFLLAQAATQKTQLPGLRNEVTELAKKVGSFEANVPADRDLGTFLQEIALLMSKHNLREQVVEPQEEIKDAGNLTRIPVNMKCKGKLNQIFEFYKELQQLNRLVRIETVKLANDNDLSGQIAMQTKAIVFYRF